MTQEELDLAIHGYIKKHLSISVNDNGHGRDIILYLDYEEISRTALESHGDW